MVPFSVNLLALLRRLSSAKHLGQVRAHGADVRRTFHDQFVGFFCDQRLDRVPHIGDQFCHVECLQVQLHLARLDLGQVQDVVDQPQQMSRRIIDARQVLGLFLLSLGLGLGQQHLKTNR